MRPSKFVERGNIDTLTQIHDLSLSWFTRYYSSSSYVIEIRVACSIVSFLLSVLWSIICFVVFLFCCLFVLSVILRLTTSDYNLGISKLFLHYTIKVANGFILIVLLGHLSILGIQWGTWCWILVFCVVFCRSLFIILTFSLLPLYCVSFFLLTVWYLQTFSLPSNKHVQ